MINYKQITSCLGVNPKVAKQLLEARVITVTPSKKGIFRLPGRIYVDPDQIKQFHNASRTSTVEPSQTVLERQNQLMRNFDHRFDQMLRDLRRGSVDEGNFARLKTIASDPDFDFFLTLPTRYKYSAFEKIILFAFEDPNHWINKEFEPRIMDDKTFTNMSEIVVPDLTRSQFEDRVNDVGNNIVVPTHLSFTYTRIATELAILLLEIAKKKGLPLNDHRMPDNIFLSFTHNQGIMDWFIDHVDLSIDQSLNRDLMKLGSRLNAFPDSEVHCEREYKEEMLKKIESLFYVSFNTKQKYQDFDAVKLLIYFASKLPEELLMRLIKFASEQGYDFKSSYWLAPGYTKDQKNADRPNLISLVIGSLENSYRKLSPKLIEFLLKQGVDPFESRTINQTVHDDDTKFDLQEKSNQLTEAIKSDDVDTLIGFFEDDDSRPSEMRSAFEACLLIIKRANDNQEEPLQNNRLKIAKLMLGSQS